jgi:hypothetical protein
MDFRRWALDTYPFGRGFQFLFLDKGKVSVPEEQKRAFLERYAEEVRQGRSIRLVEVKTQPLFVMFYDIDAGGGVDVPTLEQNVRRLISSTLQVAGGRAGSCVVVASCFRRHKKGVHVVFPQWEVDSTMALLVRDAALRDGDPLWDAAIQVDGSVYREGTGLRMLYSAKTGTDVATYVPWLRQDGCQPLQRWRCAATQDDMVEALNKFGVQSDVCGTPAAQPGLGVPASGAHALTDALRDVGALCAGCSITKCVCLTPGKKFGLRTDCRHCRNMPHVGHSSATIYFVLRLDEQRIHLVQRCYCRCATTHGRLYHKPCERLAVPVRPFPLRRTHENAFMERALNVLIA